MNYLVVYSHPNPKSFNSAIRETVVHALKQKKQDIRIRDLYALHFDPVLRASDFEALAEGKNLKDVVIEQDHVRWADILVFIYPIWWGRMPAVTCGYFDRVFSKGFAYDCDAQGLKKLLIGKKVCIINTFGAPVSEYEKSGALKSLEQMSDREIFEFCGVEVICHRHFGSVPTVTEEVRKKMLEEVAQSVAAWPAA